MKKYLHQSIRCWFKYFKRSMSICIGSAGTRFPYGTISIIWPFHVSRNDKTHKPNFSFLHRVLSHSVESPSMVDPHWDIWYWGSKWNLHTVCWSAVGCEWGRTSVYFGITYVCFVPSRLPVFAVEPQYLLQDFFLVKSIIWGTHTKSSKKFMLV